MKKAVIEAEIYAESGEIYDFLMDLENYGKYSGYVSDVRVLDDSENPVWEIDFSWWIVNYTARSKVVDHERPRYVEWRVIKDADIRGIWELEELENGNTHVELKIWYERGSASKANPMRFIPTSRLVKLVKPVASSHIRKVLRRITRDLEGEERDIDFEFKYRGDSSESNFADVVSDTKKSD